MASIIQTHRSDWDPSQFKLQSDGTFRISIRGMAAMAGIAASGLSQSLKSTETDKPLPYARALHANDLATEANLGSMGLSPVQCKVLLLYLIRTAHPCSARCSVVLRSLEEHFEEAKKFVPVFPEARLSHVNSQQRRKKKRHLRPTICI